MNEINKRRLNLMDGGIVFLISVTLLLSVNLVFTFFLPERALLSGSYFYIVGISEFLAVGMPPIIYLIVKKIPFRSIFKKRITKEQAVLCAFLAVFGYPILGFARLSWVFLLDLLNIPYLTQPIPPMHSFLIFLVATVAISFVPGLFEEVVFRGIIQEAFQKKYKVSKAIVISAFFFMLMHGDISSYTYTFAAGVALGVLYYTTGSLWAPIIYHMVNNFIGVVANYVYSILGYDDILMGNYELFPDSGEMIISIIALAVVSAVCFGICALLFWTLKKVTRNPQDNLLPAAQESPAAFLPYIVGGFLMVAIALAPVVLQMVKG